MRKKYKKTTCICVNVNLRNISVGVDLIVENKIGDYNGIEYILWCKKNDQTQKV